MSVGIPELGRHGLVLLLSICCLSSPSLACAEETPEFKLDPADLLVSNNITLGEEKQVRELLASLGSTNFDARENAVQGLVARGPVVLPLAEEYAKKLEGEARAVALGLHGRVLLQYDGYYPIEHALLEALAQPVVMTVGTQESALDFLQRMAKARGVTVLFDQRYKPDDFKLPEKAVTDGQSLRVLVDAIANSTRLAVVLRGSVVLLTSPAEAERLERQRQALNWSDLRLDRDEAARVGEGLKLFFPKGVTEIHTGSDVLSVRGERECIPRGARLVALLTPGGQPAIWPLPVAELDAAATVQTLGKPVSLALNRGDFLDALVKLDKQGVPVAILSGGARFEKPPYPVEVRGLAPVSLALKNIPMGLALRWLCRRTAFVGAQASHLELQAGLDVLNRPFVRVAERGQKVLELSVAGADVAFLTPREHQPGGKAGDEAVRAKLVEALKAHLELFPDFEIERDMCVLRGRVLLQGSPAALTHFLELVRSWKVAGHAPTCAWKQAITERLNREVEWNGTEMTAGKVLHKLRELVGVAILLEEARDGESALKRLTADQAQLLPPGKYLLYKLMDDLAAKVGARWEIHWGVLVLFPEDAAKPPAQVQDANIKRE